MVESLVFAELETAYLVGWHIYLLLIFCIDVRRTVCHGSPES